MESSVIILVTVLVSFTCVSFPQDIKVTVSDGILYKKVGDRLAVTCFTEKPARFLITNPVIWEKVGRDGSKMKISLLANIAEGLKGKYSIDVPYSEEGLAFTLKLRNGITFEDDGYLRCFIENNGNVLADATTEVVVLKNMDKMTFAIGGTELDTISSRAEPVYLEEGDYIPVCKTIGSNPASTIKIYLNDVEIGTGQTVVSAQDKSRKEPPRVFNTEKRMNLNIAAHHKGQILKCVAAVHNDTDMQGEISFLLDIYSDSFVRDNLYTVITVASIVIVLCLSIVCYFFINRKIRKCKPRIIESQSEPKLENGNRSSANANRGDSEIIDDLYELIDGNQMTHHDYISKNESMNLLARRRNCQITSELYATVVRDSLSERSSSNDSNEDNQQSNEKDGEGKQHICEVHLNNDNDGLDVSSMENLHIYSAPIKGSTFDGEEDTKQN